MLTNDKINEIFCMTDGFCRKFNEEVKKLQKLPGDGIRRRNRSIHNFIMNPDCGTRCILFIRQKTGNKGGFQKLSKTQVNILCSGFPFGRYSMF
jgi:hypothetical protein